MTRSLASLIAAFAILAGCGAAQPPRSSPGTARIASIHQAKCGSCHLIVDPGTRSRATLESALARHHSRVRLDEEDWATLVDYLATP